MFKINITNPPGGTIWFFPSTGEIFFKTPFPHIALSLTCHLSLLDLTSDIQFVPQIVEPLYQHYQHLKPVCGQRANLQALVKTEKECNFLAHFHMVWNTVHPLLERKGRFFFIFVNRICLFPSCPQHTELNSTGYSLHVSIDCTSWIAQLTVSGQAQFTHGC